METNLKMIKDYIKLLLEYPITLSVDSFGLTVNHPVFRDRIVSIQVPKTDKNPTGLELVDIGLTSNQERIKAYYRKLIDNASNATHLFLLINRLYTGFLFKQVYEYLSEEDFTNLLEHIWVSLEYPNADVNVSKRDWVKFWKKANLDYIYSDSDKKVLELLPDEFTVYRGLMNKAKVNALSWTLDKDKAIWFATRFNNKGKLYKATCKKKDILVYLSGRSESEIVVEYKKLTNVEEVSY